MSRNAVSRLALYHANQSIRFGNHSDLSPIDVATMPMGEETDSSLQPANIVTIRAKPGLILMKHAFRYIRGSGNMALMLPIPYQFNW